MYRKSTSGVSRAPEEHFRCELCTGRALAVVFEYRKSTSGVICVPEEHFRCYLGTGRALPVGFEQRNSTAGGFVQVSDEEQSSK